MKLVPRAKKVGDRCFNIIFLYSRLLSFKAETGITAFADEVQGQVWLKRSTWDIESFSQGQALKAFFLVVLAVALGPEAMIFQA